MKPNFPGNMKNILFDHLIAVCQKHLGNPRIRGSHHIFKTPWAGDPRINLQRDGKMAKPYQVKQVQKALEKLEDIQKKEGPDGTLH